MHLQNFFSHINLNEEETELMTNLTNLLMQNFEQEEESKTV